MTANRAVPPELVAQQEQDPGRRHRVLFRRSAGSARVTIFAGGHEGDMPAATAWLARHGKGQ